MASEPRPLRTLSFQVGQCTGDRARTRTSEALGATRQTKAKLAVDSLSVQPTLETIACVQAVSQHGVAGRQQQRR